jgi:hypothetical protein
MGYRLCWLTVPTAPYTNWLAVDVKLADGPAKECCESADQGDSSWSVASTITSSYAAT